LFRLVGRHGGGILGELHCVLRLRLLELR
jgi:hypothetical protein